MEEKISTIISNAENLLKEIVIKIITNPCIDGIAVGIVALLIRESGILPAYYLRDNLSFLYNPNLLVKAIDITNNDNFQI